MQADGTRRQEGVAEAAGGGSISRQTELAPSEHPSEVGERESECASKGEGERVLASEQRISPTSLLVKATGERRRGEGERERREEKRSRI